MSYLVLARKYRPQTFEELVGQEHVTRTLVNALEAKRVAHAYIFSGPRGCGKTTTARLLAKALNCVKGPTAHPCNECPQCKEIADGSSNDDVLEIDGASNRGIDQIRELRDTVKYSPSRCRYRIIIIDEAHQITDAGFNALLKTLEEPPPHAVFMMATTESQKIPSTILSRCQRFQLKSIAPADTVGQLKKILAAEKIKAEDQALLEVARAAHGGLRDALSLLDQVISYAPDGVTVQSIRDLLGLLPRERVREFAAVLREGSAEKTLQAAQKAVDEGFELGQLAQNLLDHFHELLLWRNGVRGTETANPADLEKESALYEEEDLERALQILSQTVDRLRRSESPRVSFELACLDLTRGTLPVDELLERLEAMERRLQDGGAAPMPGPVKKKSELTGGLPSSEISAPSTVTTPHPPPAPPSKAIPVGEAFLASPLSLEREKEILPASVSASPLSSEREKETPMSRTAPAKSFAVPPATPSLSSQGAVTPDSLRQAWPRVLDAVAGKKPSLESLLLSARPELSPEGSLRLLCGNEFQRSQIAGNLALLTEIVLKEVGSIPVSCALSTAPLPAAGGPAAAPAQKPSPFERPAPADDAEEVSDGGEEAPVEEEEEPASAVSPAARPAAAPASGQRTAPADEWASSSNSLVEASEIASLDPGLKKVLDRFPGKLKKLETA